MQLDRAASAAATTHHRCTGSSNDAAVPVETAAPEQRCPDRERQEYEKNDGCDGPLHASSS
jgi:hypothetical protein